MKRSKRILFVLATSIPILAVGLVVAELIFGGWINEENTNRLNLIRGCSLEYDASGLYDTQEPCIRYTRDEYGLRGSHSRAEEIDVLTVGGSTTDQRYIRDGKTWQDVLQEHLAQHGIPLVVANAGVDGQSTYGHIKNFEWWFPLIPDLSPDYILFYVGLNDFYKEAGSNYDLLGGEEHEGLMQTIRTKSAVWRLARTVHGMYQACIVNRIGHSSLDFSTIQWTKSRLQTDYSFMDTRLIEYADRLQVLAAKTQDLGAKPIFVSQPSRKYRIAENGIQGTNAVSIYDGKRYNGVDYYHMMRRLDSVTRRVAEKQGAVFVDLAAQTKWSDSDFYDFEHMTPQGAEKVGILLYERLKSEFSSAPR